MRRFALTSAALEALRGIRDYIRRDSPAAAQRVIRELRAEMALLGTHPLIGHTRDDLSENSLRAWPVYSYLILYRPDTRPLQIVRVVHGARDLRRLPPSG